MKITFEISSPIRVVREADVSDHPLNKLIAEASAINEPSKVSVAIKNTRKRLAEGLVSTAQKLLED